MQTCGILLLLMGLAQIVVGAILYNTKSTPEKVIPQRDNPIRDATLYINKALPIKDELKGEVHINESETKYSIFVYLDGASTNSFWISVPK